jgi:hypothetical protein
VTATEPLLPATNASSSASTVAPPVTSRLPPEPEPEEPFSRVRSASVTTRDCEVALTFSVVAPAPLRIVADTSLPASVSEASLPPLGIVVAPV